MSKTAASTGESGWRTVIQSLLVIATIVALVVLAVYAIAWGLTSATKTAFRGSECTVAGCVEATLAQIETETGVDFPDGTTVEWSARHVSLMRDKSLEFEVRIPAGATVPDPTYPLGGTGEWTSEPAPDTGLPREAEEFAERGLKDVRWSGTGWTTGVDSNGASIVSGSHVVPD